MGIAIVVVLFKIAHEHYVSLFPGFVPAESEPGMREKVLRSRMLSCYFAKGFYLTC
jgi:hypothetical protein